MRSRSAPPRPARGQDEGTAPGIRVRVPGRGIGRGNTAREQGRGTKHVVLDDMAE